MSPQPQLSVVVPAYNEERRLGPTLARVMGWLKRHRIRFELIVVDDGSTDGTAALVAGLAKKQPGLKLIKLPGNAGKGAAVKAGVLGAKGRLILMSDADLSTPIEEYLVLEAALRQGADLAIGSRALDRGRITKRQPFYREAGGRVFNRFVQWLTIEGIQDTQCGFKLFKAAAARDIFRLQCVPRFGFDVEALYIAKKMGLKIAELSVGWENSAETKVRPVRDGLRTFADLLLIRYYDLSGRYQ